MDKRLRRWAQVKTELCALRGERAKVVEWERRVRQFCFFFSRLSRLFRLCGKLCNAIVPSVRFEASSGPSSSLFVCLRVIFYEVNIPLLALRGGRWVGTHEGGRIRRQLPWATRVRKKWRSIGVVRWVVRRRVCTMGIEWKREGEHFSTSCEKHARIKQTKSNCVDRRDRDCPSASGFCTCVYVRHSELMNDWILSGLKISGFNYSE